jgi:hypothetical protein
MPIDLPPGIRSGILHFTKVDVARTQLKTAIRLWFHDGDPVSIHTLAYAAYEIIHFVSKKRNRTKQLIFDTLSVKDEYRGKWAKTIKEHANFPRDNLRADVFLSIQRLRKAISEGASAADGERLLFRGHQCCSELGKRSKQI